MHAALDWSHELLSETERVVLRRLAVFAGDFTLEAAQVVATSDDISSQDVGECVATLVAKSLLSTDVLGPRVRYRLLETTRAYAREKLAASDELEQSARRHAEYHRELFVRAEAESAMRAAADWLAAYRPQMDNLRAALDWAFSPAGDATIAVELTAAAIPLWMHMALAAECRSRIEEAIACIERDVPADARRDMRLYLALGMSGLSYTQDPDRSRMIAALTKALRLAEQVGDSQYCLRAMWGLYIFCFRAADYRQALSLAERFRAVAARTLDPFDDLIAERLIGIVLHVLGDQRGALQRIGPLASTDFTTDRHAHILRFQYDQRVVTHCHYSKIVWLHGRADHALHVAERIVEYARTSDHVPSLLYALVQGACAISLYCGDLLRVERHGEVVRGLAVRHGLEAWRPWCRAFEGALLIKRGNAAAGSRLLATALEEFPEGALYLNTNLFAELAGGLAASGQIREGLALVDNTLAHVDRTEEAWCRAELFRTKGELLLLGREPGVLAEAEACLRRALDVAQQQGALSWELRAATSLARLWAGQGRNQRAQQLLAPVYDRFAEGFGTADLIAAQTLLSSLA
jgi:predicted ATPase